MQREILHHRRRDDDLPVDHAEACDHQHNRHGQRHRKIHHLACGRPQGARKLLKPDTLSHTEDRDHGAYGRKRQHDGIRVPKRMLRVPHKTPGDIDKPCHQRRARQKARGKKRKERIARTLADRCQDFPLHDARNQNDDEREARKHTQYKIQNRKHLFPPEIRKITRRTYSPRRRPPDASGSTPAAP